MKELDETQCLNCGELNLFEDLKEGLCYECNIVAEYLWMDSIINQFNNSKIKSDGKQK